jgi:predicted membrane protein DUF2207
MPRQTLRLVILACALLSSAPGAAAAAKDYTAQRFDSRAEILADGSLRVTEVIVFRFSGGTFTEVFREIPTRHTDGVQVLSTGIDGRPTAAGEVAIASGERVRVTWRLAPTSNATRTFTLAYVIRGAVRRDGDRDLLAWRALPNQHAYRIDASHIEIAWPPAAKPRIAIDDERVADDVRWDGRSNGAVIDATAIRRNGWVEVKATFPAGSVITELPRWQARQQAADRLAPRWLLGGGAILMLAVILFGAMRQSYSPPSGDATSVGALPDMPDALPPSFAGALIANGNPRFEHAMAALLSLAQHGHLRISEASHRRLGQRTFTLERAATASPLADSERALLDLAFKSERSVPLAKARARVTRGFRRYRNALLDDMAAAGLVDQQRRQVRQRYFVIGLALLIASAPIAIVSGALLFDDYGPWTLVLPASVGLAGLIGLMFAASVTPLSDDGAYRARYWEGFRRHLRDVARDRAVLGRDASVVVPFAVAMGLAAGWAKYVKTHAIAAPDWFRALSSPDARAAFGSFVATTGATSGHGGGGGGAGGAVGGGASGAH